MNNMTDMSKVEAIPINSLQENQKDAAIEVVVLRQGYEILTKNGTLLRKLIFMGSQVSLPSPDDFVLCFPNYTSETSNVTIMLYKFLRIINNINFLMVVFFAKNYLSII